MGEVSSNAVRLLSVTAELPQGHPWGCLNTMMAAAAFNMRHWMNKNALSSFVSWLKTLVGRLENVLFENRKQYACRRLTLAMVRNRGLAGLTG